MKKSVLLLAGSVLLSSISFAQCDPSAVTKRWVNTDNPAKGEMPGTIPISITDNSVQDWRTHILGTLTTTGTVDYQNYNPYLAPNAPGNIQVDGYDKAKVINNVSGTDRDQPQASSRDLRYFAFTFDRTNLYFYFRRPANSNTQMSFYYFMDINADGFMRTGEPVVRISFTNNSVPSLQMCYYQEANPVTQGNITGKGDPMTSPSTGFADGYSMQGKVVQINTQPEPSSGELFAAASVEEGFGTEFVVPFSFLKSYAGASLPAANFNRIFTWHVALDNGTGGNAVDASKFEDNAGGCCSGVAVSGDPLTELAKPVSISANSNPYTQFRAKLNYLEKAGASTKIAINSISFKNTTVMNVTPDPTKYTVKVYAGDASGNPVGMSFTFGNPTSANGLTKYVPTGNIPTVDVAANSSAWFVVDMDFITTGIKTVDVDFEHTSTLNLQEGSCVSVSAASKATSTIVVATALPVKYNYFNVSRNANNKQQIDLAWETSMEQNNKGFYVQRKTDGDWKDIGLVFSASDNGNSNTPTLYRFKDQNIYTGNTQYRLLQVDFDGKSAYSEVKAIAGEDFKSGIFLFPNPVTNGVVNVLFANSGVRNIFLSDMNGRAIRQFRNYAQGSLILQGLRKGFYTLRVDDVKTGAVNMEKIIVH